ARTPGPSGGTESLTTYRRRAMSGSADTASGLEGYGRQGGRRNGVARIAVDGPVAVACHPVLAVLGDLLAGAGDEVPPHDDLLFEGFAAQEQEPGRVVGAQRQVV